MVGGSGIFGKTSDHVEQILTGQGGLTWKNEHGQYVGDSESPASSTVVSALPICERNKSRPVKPDHWHGSVLALATHRLTLRRSS